MENMLRVQHDDIDLRFGDGHWDYAHVTYKGKPFTGILLKHEEECEFEDGNANGRCFCNYENGQLKEETLFEKGWQISYRSFYENGNPKKITKFRERGSTKRWSEEGHLLQDGYTTYWSNGNIKILGSKHPNSVKFYTQNGSLFCTKTSGKDENNTPKDKYHFEEEVLDKHYIELLKPEHIVKTYSEEEKDHKRIVRQVEQWLIITKRKDLQRFNELIKNVVHIFKNTDKWK